MAGAVAVVWDEALAAADEPPSCGSFDLPVTKSTCTHHFKVLRESGVIQQRDEGTRRMNRLRRDELDERLQQCREIVKERGVSLEIEAAAEGMTLTV